MREAGKSLPPPLPRRKTKQTHWSQRHVGMGVALAPIRLRGPGILRLTRTENIKSGANSSTAVEIGLQCAYDVWRRGCKYSVILGK